MSNDNDYGRWQQRYGYVSSDGRSGLVSVDAIHDRVCMTEGLNGSAIDGAMPTKIDLSNAVCVALQAKAAMRQCQRCDSTGFELEDIAKRGKFVFAVLLCKNCGWMVDHDLKRLLAPPAPKIVVPSRII